MATSDFVNHFNENGFVVLPSAIPGDQIVEMFEDISAVFDEGLSAAGLNASHYKSCDDKMLALAAHNSRMKSHCYDVLGTLDCVHRASSNPKITAIAREITGSPVCKQAVQVRMDSNENSHILPMHQELELMSLLGVAVWIPLIDVTSESVGGLRVVPRSHELGLLKHITREQSASGSSEVIWNGDPGDAQDIKISRGDALLFHPFLIHGSSPNFSDIVRWTLVFRLCDINTMPYLKDSRAPLTMSRNPDPNDPGCAFVSEHVLADRLTLGH